MLFRIFLLLTISFLLTSCASRYLEVKSEYLDKNFLASQQVDTPDPMRGCFQGQQLIVKWRLPWSCIIHSNDVHLDVTVRFGDRSFKTFVIPLEKNRGWWVLRLINDDYWCKGGMISYKAEIIADGNLLQKWHHHVWVNLIEINTEDKITDPFPDRVIITPSETVEDIEIIQPTEATLQSLSTTSDEL